MTGPWIRIKTSGATFADDIPGLKSAALGLAFRDASSMGIVLDPANPLPETLSVTDLTSPKAVRFSYGGLVLDQPEYALVKLKILADPGDANSPFDANGCFFLNTDSFGGDAAASSGGKDHLWRYYDPSLYTVNPCAMIQKVFVESPLAPGETSYFDISVINTGKTALSGVKVRDQMPSGLIFLCSVPARDAGTSTSSPEWTLGNVPAEGYVNIRVQFQAIGSGIKKNIATLETNENPDEFASDVVYVGKIPLLEAAKSVTPENTAPGTTVTYTVTLENIGTGSTSDPVIVTPTACRLALPTTASSVRP